MEINYSYSCALSKLNSPKRSDSKGIHMKFTIFWPSLSTVFENMLVAQFSHCPCISAQSRRSSALVFCYNVAATQIVTSHHRRLSTWRYRIHQSSFLFSFSLPKLPLRLPPATTGHITSLSLLPTSFRSSYTIIMLSSINSRLSLAENQNSFYIAFS